MKISDLLSFRISKSEKYPFEGKCFASIKNYLHLRLSWDAPTMFTHIKIGVDQATLKYSVALPLIAFWFTFSGSAIHNIVKKISDLEYSISYHDYTIWWNLGTDSHCWSSKTPRWQHGCFNIADAILGIPKVSIEKIGCSTEILAHFLEGSYIGICQLQICQRKRARWFTHNFHTAKIEMQELIPMPGKGENSWDCDEDALHSISVPAKSIAEAIGKLTISILEKRIQRAGINWKPINSNI